MIGLFDSGIGGLTVLKALTEQFPHENFVYLGDTARLPYGSKSASTIERYLHQNVEFLQALGVKAIVVACNTASTVLIGRAQAFATAVPLYNVIEPGALRAMNTTRNGRIGILGTRATVNAKSYVTSLHNLRSDLVVEQHACPLLVPLVEEGWINDPITNLIVYRYLQPLVQKGIDTLVLGCTHYPLLSEAIRRVVGPDIELVDSAHAVAERLRHDAAAGRFVLNAEGVGVVRLLATDTSPHFSEIAARFMAPFAVGELEAVDIGTGNGSGVGSGHR